MYSMDTNPKNDSKPAKMLVSGPVVLISNLRSSVVPKLIVPKACIDHNQIMKICL